MKNRYMILKHKMQVTDIIILILCYYLAHFIIKKEFCKEQLLVLIILCGMWYFSTLSFNLYDDFKGTTFFTEITNLLPNVLFQFFLLGFLYFLLNDREFARTITLYYISISTILIVTKNYVIKKWKLTILATGFDKRNLLIVGEGDQTRSLINTINTQKHYGYSVIGYVSDHESSMKCPYLGKLNSFEEIIKKYQVNEIIISAKKQKERNIISLIHTAEKFAVRIRIIPEYLPFYLHKSNMEVVGNVPIITMRQEPLETFYWALLKGIFDVVIATILFAFVFIWLFPLIAILIKLDSSGPVFYIQDRWGQYGKPFKFYKFRTMQHNCETCKANGGFNQTIKGDTRITTIGKILRKTNLDELPQFLNVFLGDMSIVGPRPHAVQHSLETKEQIDNYLQRHLIKPGITGWAQVNGYRGETTDFHLMEKRVEFDIWYIENWTFWLDIRVVIMTIYNMLKGQETAF